MAKNSSLSAVAFTCDVLVVGAGPAGIAAALTLHAAGKHVIVIDKAKFPRDKCCGDGLTTGALRLLDELGFDPNTVSSWRQCDEVWLRSPRGRETMLPLPRNSGQFAAIAPRLKLDNALVGQARASGIEVRENHEFAALTQTDDHVVVEIGGRESITSRHLIAADGMWSPVRKSLGLSTAGYLGEWHAFRQYADKVEGPAKDRLYVWFEKDLLPGYAWSFPLANGRVNIGFGILRGGKHSVQDMKQLWPEILARPHIAAALGASAEMVDRHTAWPIPARVTTAPLGSGRVLFVGDAACVTDTLTGEGIGQALLSGILAARAISECADMNQVTLQSRYRKMLKQNLFADHRMSALLGFVLRSPLLASGALRIASLTSWSRRNFARWMFEDEPRAAVFTPRRWHRGFLKRSGAFADSPPR